MEFFEYEVRLHNSDDLDDFYIDMETPGGNITIPIRIVDVKNKRPNSKATNYMLTTDEAELVRQDARVRFVEYHDENMMVQHDSPSTYARYNDYSPAWDQWGIYRHQLYSDNKDNPSPFNYTDTVQKEFDLPYSGKNVDVVILDDVGWQPYHAEFLDDNGASRVVDYNWGKHSQVVENKYRNWYHDTSNNNTGTHNIHVAGTVAGKTQGWATESNIYFLQLNFGSGHANNSATVHPSHAFDYIREFHNSKPINSLTGRKNPTVVNNSWSSKDTDAIELQNISSLVKDGISHYPVDGNEFTASELYTHGMYYNHSGDYNHTQILNSAGVEAAVEDCIDAGVIITASAGNADMIIHNDNRRQNYANVETHYYGGYVETSKFYYNMTGHPGSAYIGTDKQTIIVGALDSEKHTDGDERRAAYSNHGTSVDVYAAGTAIISSVPNHGWPPSWYYQRGNNNYYGMMSGTSMATPQVTGMIACMLEKYPDMDQRQVRELLSKITGEHNPMKDGNGDFSQAEWDLSEGHNRVLYYPDFKPTDKQSHPDPASKGRPLLGVIYPRNSIRKRHVI